jgi:hypothetical protein
MIKKKYAIKKIRTKHGKKWNQVLRGKIESKKNEKYIKKKQSRE